MEKSSPTHKSLFTQLPDNVKTLIFEFCDLKDYGNIAATCSEFNRIINEQPALWARHVCNDFMNPTCTEAPASFQQLFPPNNELKEGQIAYSGMAGAREQIINHLQINGRFRVFLLQYFDAQTVKTFLTQMMQMFKDPNFPSPLHKKDAHYFPTNTVFQNFLTEVHFNIQGKTFFQTNKQKVLVDLVKKMEKELPEKETDPAELARLRWYLYEEENQEKEEDSPEEPEERMIKPKENLTLKRMAREKTNENISLQGLQAKYFPSEEPQSVTKVNTPLEELYYILYALVENYAAMICDYLTALKNPYLLLSEYSRLWNKFVLITIEFSQIFHPYVLLFQKVYEDKCRHLPNFPDFSVWRMMLKIWIEEVHTPFGYYLNESFRYVVKKTRNEEKLIEYNQKNLKNSQTEDKDKDVNDVPEEEFPDKPDATTFKDKYHLNKQKLKNILKGYYDSIEDLSHNEFSIFYWDCDNDAKGEPKQILDDLIMQDSKSYYEECKKTVTYNKPYFKKLLKNDYELVGNIFGKLFNLDVKKMQAAIMKDLLLKEFKAAINEVEKGTEESKGKNEDKKKLSGNVNFEQVLRLLKNEGVEDNKYFTAEKREKIAAVLAKDSDNFNSYLFHLMEEEKDIEDQNREMEDMKHFRYIRGFTLTDQRFKSFFDLGKVPSFVEIHQPGLQRLNTRENLEDKDDRIEFL